jgi:hypothetical protein
MVFPDLLGEVTLGQLLLKGLLKAPKELVHVASHTHTRR